LANTIVGAVAAYFTILGSGSAGNCAYLETADTRILIDAGLSFRQIRQRLALIGRTPESLNGILVTHEHSDHVHAIDVLTRKIPVPVYCNRLTHEAIQSQIEGRFDCRVFATGAAFDIGDISVETFAVPHDAQDPVGFVLRANGARVGILTDLGHVTKLALERVRQSNVLVLEANHDVKMLQECVNRPWSLKQRIMSRHGHLSNEAAADAAQEIVSAELRHLVLGHLSRQCNSPDLARTAVGNRLEAIGATHVNLVLAVQETPCPTLTI